MITMVQVECKICYGDGFEEVSGDCSYPASMCCGGCVKTYKCEECDGLGYVYEDLEEEFED
jgi:hypothetical protein